MKIFVDDSGDFSWLEGGVSLFCAVTISDRTHPDILTSFESWKSRQENYRPGVELKGKDLSTLQKSSFVNSVILENIGIRVTLAGTRTTLFRKDIAVRYIQDLVNIFQALERACAKTGKEDLVAFYGKMAVWIRNRSPENLMWLYTLGNALRLSVQHSIVLFMTKEHDPEFEETKILIDKSFIAKSTHIQFWREWLRNFLYTESKRKPTKIPREWSQRDHPFNGKHQRATGLTNWTDLYRDNVQFADSASTPELQIADICANICYKHYSSEPKYRPFRLLRSRVMGEGNSLIHIGILDESSLLTKGPEAQISEYTAEELAAIDEWRSQD